jgi:hypothetical protein
MHTERRIDNRSRNGIQMFGYRLAFCHDSVPWCSW